MRQFVLGFNESLKDTILEKFNDKILSNTLIKEKDGYSCLIDDSIGIDDVKEISDKWLYLDVGLLVERFIVKCEKGELILDEDNFPIVEAKGIFSFLDGFNISENHHQFIDKFGICMDKVSDNLITLSVIADIS